MVCIPYGNGTRHVGSHLGKYENGDLILIGSNTPHSGFGLNSDLLHEEIVVQMNEELFTKHLTAFKETTRIIQLIEKCKLGVHFFGDTKKKATEKLLTLSNLNPMERFVELISVFHLLSLSKEYELLNSEIFITPAFHKNNIRLQNVFNYIERHFHEEISIQKIASLAHLSVPAFCNYFKKTVNFTFTDFLNQYRIQRACLLLQQEKSVSEISFECGFNNVAYFNKVFKNILKKTPSEYRKQKLIAA